MAIRPGDVLGKYRVSRQLEDGWLAERTQDFEQQVFVALLPENFTNADEVEFLERRQKVAQLHETAIPRLISSGETREGLPYTLFDYTQTEAALAVAEGENRPLRQRVDLAIQVLEALSGASVTAGLRESFQREFPAHSDWSGTVAGPSAMLPA